MEKMHIFSPGDIIKVKSMWSHISPKEIWHYGVVVENNQVVHFNLDPDFYYDMRIIKTDMREFVRFSTNLHTCYMSMVHSKFKPSEICARANSQVGSNFGGYNLLTNNCEHFANWCSTGNRFSNQVFWGEGTEHTFLIKVFDNAVIDPIGKATDNIISSIVAVGNIAEKVTTTVVENTPFPVMMAISEVECALSEIQLKAESFLNSILPF